MKCILSGDLTITTAAEARSQLLRALVAPNPLALDTSQVTEVDAAGLQIVLAALKSASSARIPIHFPSEARGSVVAAGLALLGIGECDWTHEDRDHGQANPRR
jgi:anti-sigma B factor antagonist